MNEESKKAVMTVNDRKAAVGGEKKYDCMTCPYPRYRCGHIIFCDVCMQKVLEEKKKQRKEQPSE